jgi:hypothetical protein
MDLDDGGVHRIAATISRDRTPRSRRRSFESCFAQPLGVVICIRGALKGVQGEQPVDTGDLFGEHTARELAAMVALHGLAVPAAHSSSRPRWAHAAAMKAGVLHSASGAGTMVASASSCSRALNSAMPAKAAYHSGW